MREYRDWANTDHDLYDAIAVGMQARGAMPEPDSREPWFLCAAHDEADEAKILEAFSVVARRGTRGARPPRRQRPRRRGGGPARVTVELAPAPVDLAPTLALDGNAVRSVDRAAALLLALGDSQGEAGVTELARRLGLHKSTASRLLATLQRRGLVEQDGETGKYRLGLVVIRLAERAERTLDLRGIAMPELERLARLTRETTGLGVLDGRLPADRRPGRRSEPHRRRRLDGADLAAPLRRLGQGPPGGPGRARGPADRPGRPRRAHRADDHRARAAPRGAGPDPAAGLRDGDRRVRARDSTRWPPRSAMPAGRSSRPSTSGDRPSGSRPARMTELIASARETAAAISVRLGGATA